MLGWVCFGVLLIYFLVHKHPAARCTEVAPSPNAGAVSGSEDDDRTQDENSPCPTNPTDYCKNLVDTAVAEAHAEYQGAGSDCQTCLVESDGTCSIDPDSDGTTTYWINASTKAARQCGGLSADGNTRGGERIGDYLGNPSASPPVPQGSCPVDCLCPPDFHADTTRWSSETELGLIRCVRQ